MHPPAFCVVGVCPDSTVGIRLFVNSPGQAQLLASFLRWQNGDWNVLIKPCPESDDSVPVESGWEGADHG